MAAKSSKGDAWSYFDYIVSAAAPGGKHDNPWRKLCDGQLVFDPDYVTLTKLLGVPLYLKANTQSGVPALALDVWLSYELRRAGFESDRVWPRPTTPRILPAAIPALLRGLPAKLRGEVEDRIAKLSSITGVTGASAKILGKNYFKQVDVIMTDWATGPELLVSTKRMDSSYGKNAPNRIEESYGDAKNLRLRHPLAALGFMFGLRSDILYKEANTAEWLCDLLIKLGQEDDAYHATCLVLMEYDDALVQPGSAAEPPADLPQGGVVNEDGEDVDGEGKEIAAPPPAAQLAQVIADLPKVTIRTDRTPAELGPGRFLAAMVNRVLGATPVTQHREARALRASAAPPVSVEEAEPSGPAVS